jgi:hypothetical protein
MAGFGWAEDFDAKYWGEQCEKLGVRFEDMWGALP